MKVNTLPLTLLLVLIICGCRHPAASVDASRIKPGMSVDQVQKELGQPLPGVVNNDQINKVVTVTWIYPAGDDAVFVTFQNDVVKEVTKKRVTMKDAAAKIKVGMGESEVKSLIGEPAGDGLPLNGEKRVTYLNNDAAIDSLTVTYKNGSVSKIEVVANSAINR